LDSRQIGLPPQISPGIAIAKKQDDSVASAHPLAPHQLNRELPVSQIRQYKYYNMVFDGF
jgi:hypothetical protein